jgi:three-Cys-motif partner protein
MATTKKLWPLEPHTLGKHLVLKNYLNAWFPVMGTWNGRILFIDGFAGPGEYEGGEVGSPIIALDSFSDHMARNKITSEVVFDFVEANGERAEHLKHLISRRYPTLPTNCLVDVATGQFDQTMTGLLDELDRQHARLAPAFVMIDPFGVSDTPMAVIRRILKNPRSEVYISFMYEAINRFKETPEFERHLDSLFGCESWRKGLDIEDGHERKTYLYDLYAGQLRNNGARYVVRFELYSGNRLIYAVFFGTQHVKGANLLKEAIWKVAPFGDFAFHGTRSGQLTLDILSPDFGPLQVALRMEFKRKGWLPIGRIEEFVESDRTDYHLGQLRKGALVPMEDMGQLEVDEATHKRKHTYPAGTRIRFV